METKSIATEIKAIGDGGFEGYASVFAQRDSYDDMVIAGAYTKTIQERKGKIRALWNHDSMTPPIGRFTRMEEDTYGLSVSAEFSKTAFAQDVRTLVQEQALDAMSIGYQVVKADYGTDNEIDVRFLREIKLFEISIVAFPALESALITGAKNLSHLERTITQLDDLISVGIKSGRPLSADNLTRLQKSYAQLHALLQAKASAFNEGDRVTVKHAHMEGQDTGTIKLIHPGPAYGIEFDGMEEMGTHKWYVTDELEAESDDKKKKPKKPMHGMHGKNNDALSESGEPLTHSRTSEAAIQETEPPEHSDDLLSELKAFTPSIQRTADESAVLAEIKRAFSFIHTGA